MNKYDAIESMAGVLWCLKPLKQIEFNFEEQKDVADVLLAGDQTFHKCAQGGVVSVAQYLYEFKS